MELPPEGIRQEPLETNAGMKAKSQQARLTEGDSHATWKRATWVLIALPWITTLPPLAFFCWRACRDGVLFVQGLHGLQWLMNVAIVAVIYVLPFIIAVFAVLKRWHELRKRRQLALAAMIVAGSLVLPFGARRLISTSFYGGRHAAYTQLDYAAIYEASLDLQDHARKEGGQIVFSVGNENLQQLPPALRRLRPLFVCVTRHGATIQMDGGGSMYHEGIGVSFSRQPSVEQTLTSKFERLDPSVPVFLYRLYDHVMFLDEVEDASSPAHPTDVANTPAALGP